MCGEVNIRRVRYLRLILLPEGTDNRTGPTIGIAGFYMYGHVNVRKFFLDVLFEVVAHTMRFFQANLIR